MKFEIKKGNIENNGFNFPVKLYDTIRIYVDSIENCFVVLRNLNTYKKEIKMFNDMIYLIDRNNTVLDCQKCDSTAGLNPVASWEKIGQDAYTLSTGIYDIKKTVYKEKNAFELVGGYTKGGYKIGTRKEGGEFSKKHLIHYIGWNEDASEKDIKKADRQWFDNEGYRSGSGGCITIPKRLDGKNNIIQFAIEKNPKYVIIFEYD
jgi:hypothetical protein